MLFLVQQIIFRLHMLHSCDTMLFNKASAEFAASGNAVKTVRLVRNEGYQMKEQGNNAIRLFEDQKIRVAWGAEREEWYFSVVDVVAVLTVQPDYNTGRKYWNKLKQRLKEEGSELVTNCHQLKMRAADSKNRLTDVADTEQLLMSMQDWLNETDRFLTNNRRKVLDGKGHISREAAAKKVGAIYDEFRKKQDEAYISEFDRQTEKYLKGE